MLRKFRPLAPLVALTVTAFGCGAATGAENLAFPLSGEARLDQSQCRGKGTGPGCIISFEFSGEIARTLYEHMTSTAEIENCTGGRVKWDRSGLRCFKGIDGTHVCDAGYNFSKQSFAVGDMSC